MCSNSPTPPFLLKSMRCFRSKVLEALLQGHIQQTTHEGLGPLLEEDRALVAAEAHPEHVRRGWSWDVWLMVWLWGHRNMSNMRYVYYVYIYMYIYISTYVYMYIHIYTYIHTLHYITLHYITLHCITYIDIHTYIHTYIHVAVG